MITRREFGHIGAGVVALAGFAPALFLREVEAQSIWPSGEGDDIRRIGVRRNGAYWGAGEEKIDLLSGNLSFSIPLIHARSRSAAARVRGSYNSQIWKQSLSGAKSFGSDSGSGYGWKIQIAAVVPKTKNGEINGYVFVDGTGAEYALIQNGQLWTSLDGHYITWDPGQSLLLFPNGSSLRFGSTSGSGEPDAGTLYPTLIECSNGNQILVSYLPGVGQGGSNTSSRISNIQDARAGYSGNGTSSYAFLYSSDRLPRLMSIVNSVNTGESYSFSYTSKQISSPFGRSEDGVQFASMLQAITYASGHQRSFSYNGYGELVEAQQPHGGVLSWDYRTFTFQDGRGIREVSSRSLADPYGPSNTHSHAFSRDAGDGGGAVHSSAVITGPTESAQTRWTFVDDAGSPDRGLASTVESLSSGSVVRRKSLTWSRTQSGIPYVSSHAVVLDPGTSSQKTASAEIVRDYFGNVTSHATFDYDSATTPSRVVTHSYLQDQAYLDGHILNRKLSTTVQGSGETLQVETRQYDTTPLTSRSGLAQHDSVSFHSGNTVRGNVTESYVGGVYKRVQYDTTGTPTAIQDSAGKQIALIPAEGTNNTLVGTIIPNGNANLGLQIQYQGGKPSVVTKPNGAQTSFSYDAIGRTTGVTSPDGATASFAYGTSPTTVTKTINGRSMTTTHGGFGHALKSELGDESGVQTSVAREYAPAAHAPLGKLSRASLPYGAGAQPQWVGRTYDDLGRRVSQDLASTGAPMKISYAGNTVQATDPAGRWKQLVHNAQGKIAKVVMPDADGSSQLETLYSYNALGKMTGVLMPRKTGTQTRRFTYDSGGRIVLRKHAESGAQTRKYNSDGTLASYTDANGQNHVYTRDVYKRVTSINRYDAGGSLQSNDSYKYYYDTNPFDTSFSQNSQGRLAAVQFGSPGTRPGLVTEMYSYTASGHLAAKRLRLNRGTNDADLDVHFSYDEEGRVTSVQYPQGGPSLAYSYDSMGRQNGVLSANDSVVKDVVYNSVGQLQAMKLLAGEEGIYLAQGYQYDSRNRLTRITAAPDDASDSSRTLPSLDLQYAYRNDDGKLLSETDNIAATSVSYDYDNQGRLAGAQSSDSSWGLSFGYDGFGNRVSQTVTAGQAYSQQVQHDPATNWMMSPGTDYDANGNIIRLPQMQLSYDAQNRLVKMSNANTGTEVYGYDQQNMRIWKQAIGGREIFTFYQGTKRLATYNLITDATGNIAFKLRESNVFFGGRMVKAGGQILVTDRLGATRAWGGNQGAGSTRYLPFGEELRRTMGNSTKFGGYLRDDASGLDYAEQRYYSSSLGRFITPDPYEKSAHIKNPGSWNRYAFVSNDPINRVDPHGLNDGNGGNGNDDNTENFTIDTSEGTVTVTSSSNVTENDDGTFSGTVTTTYTLNGVSVTTTMTFTDDALTDETVQSSDGSVDTEESFEYDSSTNQLTTYLDDYNTDQETTTVYTIGADGTATPTSATVGPIT
jgi:RHS repeat-associated protein